MCVQSIKRLDAIQNGFTVPLYRESFMCARAREISYLSENIGSAWASLVIQHYGQGTIRINLEVRNPATGGLWPLHISLWPAVERRRANGREEYSLGFRSLRVVKKKRENIPRGRDILFLSAQLDCVWFYTVEYATRRPRFYIHLTVAIVTKCDIALSIVYHVVDAGNRSEGRICDAGMLDNFSREQLCKHEYFIPDLL